MNKKLRIVFMGTPEFAIPSLKEISKVHKVISVYTQSPKSSGRGMKTRISPVNIFAKTKNIPVFTPSSFSKLEEFEILENLKPDFIIVIAYGLLLPSKVLSLPKYSCINGHASDLPRWRGAAPIHRAIEAGDKETACCAMIMEETLDTGPVVYRKKLPIKPNDTTLSLHNKLSILMPSVILKAIDLISKNNDKPMVQSNIGVTYAKKVSKHETKINWENEPNNILRKLLAFSPFPGCWTYHNGIRLRIHNAVEYKFNKKPPFSPSGTIECFSNDGCPIISSTNGKFLKLLEIQKQGKNKMHSSDFLRGYKINLGDKFQ